MLDVAPMASALEPNMIIFGGSASAAADGGGGGAREPSTTLPLLYALHVNVSVRLRLEMSERLGGADHVCHALCFISHHVVSLCSSKAVPRYL